MKSLIIILLAGVAMAQPNQGKTKLKLGNYELASGPTNDWHYVTITKKGRRSYTWTNKAGVSWTLKLEKNKLKVGEECPYYKNGYRKATFNSTGIMGPGGEFYKLQGGKDRAIGALTSSDYATRFTEDSQKLLAGLDLKNRRLVKDDSVRPTTETITWTQVSKCLWSCEEDYHLVDYYLDGDKSKNAFKVFIAKDTTPPSQFQTSGYNGKLHFGFLTFGTDDGAVFFVIHPKDWYPYQHRFKTNSITAFFKGGLSSAASTVAGAAAGAAMGSIVPGLGTAVGAIVGYGASTLTDDYFGDYLRYIG